MDWSVAVCRRTGPSHQIGHELTALFGLDHARSLAVVMPGVLRHQRDRKRAKLLQYAERVWNLRDGDENARIEQAIAASRAILPFPRRRHPAFRPRHSRRRRRGGRLAFGQARHVARRTSRPERKGSQGDCGVAGVGSCEIDVCNAVFLPQRGTGSSSPGHRPGEFGLVTLVSAQRAKDSANYWPVGPTIIERDLLPPGQCPGLGEHRACGPEDDYGANRYQECLLRQTWQGWRVG